MNQSSTIVITGVTKGLGRALSEAFIQRGCNVIGCGRSTEKIEQLTHLYPDHDFAVVDLSNNDQVQDWANRVIQKWGSPDWLINNAAIINPPTALSEQFEPFYPK